MHSSPILRPAAASDLDLLWEFLAMAAYEPSIAAARAIPVVAAHLAGWKRPEDFGFVAEEAGAAVGAAWARQFAPEEKPTFYFGPRTPEISIAVRPEARGMGVGSRLLRALPEEAARRGLRLCLQVRHDNPARRLYERVGFRPVPGAAVRNRTGGWSIGMLLSDSQPG